MLGCDKFTTLHVNKDTEFNSAVPANFSKFVLRLGSSFHYGTLEELGSCGLVDPQEIYCQWGVLSTLGPKPEGLAIKYVPSPGDRVL